MTVLIVGGMTVLWATLGLTVGGFTAPSRADCVKQIEARELTAVCYEELYGLLPKSSVD